MYFARLRYVNWFFYTNIWERERWGSKGQMSRSHRAGHIVAASRAYSLLGEEEERRFRTQSKVHCMGARFFFALLIRAGQWTKSSWTGAIINEMEKALGALAVVIGGAKNFCPAADPLAGGAGRPKFNQLEMVTTFTYRPSLVKIDARNFELSW